MPLKQLTKSESLTQSPIELTKKILSWPLLIRQQRSHEGFLDVSKLESVGFSNWQGALNVAIQGVLLDKKQNLGWLQVNIAGYIHLICQRCQQNFALPINYQTKLLPVLDSQQCNPWPDVELTLVDSDALDVWQLVGQELLLVLPMIPKHNVQDWNSGKCLDHELRSKYLV